MRPILLLDGIHYIAPSQELSKDAAAASATGILRPIKRPLRSFCAEIRASGTRRHSGMQVLVSIGGRYRVRNGQRAVAGRGGRRACRAGSRRAGGMGDGRRKLVCGLAGLAHGANARSDAAVCPRKPSFWYKIKPVAKYNILTNGDRLFKFFAIRHFDDS